MKKFPSDPLGRCFRGGRAIFSARWSVLLLLMLAGLSSAASAQTAQSGEVYEGGEAFTFTFTIPSSWTGNVLMGHGSLYTGIHAIGNPNNTCLGNEADLVEFGHDVCQVSKSWDSTTRTFTVTLKGIMDTQDEDNEIFYFALYDSDNPVRILDDNSLTIKNVRGSLVTTTEPVYKRLVKSKPHNKTRIGYEEGKCDHREGKADLWFEILLSSAVQRSDQRLDVGYRVEMQDPKDNTRYIPVRTGAYQFNANGERKGNIRVSSENDVYEADGVHAYRFRVLPLAPHFRSAPPAVPAVSGTGFGPYTLGSPNTVEINVCDNEPAPGTLVFSSGSVSVPEGSSREYKLKLSSEPSGNVEVRISGVSGTDVTVDTNPNQGGAQNTLSFTPSDWKTEKTVLVRAGQDNDFYDDSMELTHTASGGGYRDTGKVKVTVTDDEQPDKYKIVFSPRDSLTVAEGGSATYRVRLSSRPLVPITVRITGASGTDVTVDTDPKQAGNQDTLSFTPWEGGRWHEDGNGKLEWVPVWREGKEVTVTAGQDNDQSDDTVTLTHTSNSGNGTYTYRGNRIYPPANVTVTVADDDKPSNSEPLNSEPEGEGGEQDGVTLPPEVSVTPEAGVSEGTAAVFTLTANPAPAAALTVAVTVAQSGDYAAAGATGSKTVTIPTGGTATYSVATVDDSTDEANGSVLLTVNNGNGYTVGNAGAASVVVTDNDAPTVERLQANDGGGGASCVSPTTGDHWKEISGKPTTGGVGAIRKKVKATFEGKDTLTRGGVCDMAKANVEAGSFGSSGPWCGTSGHTADWEAIYTELDRLETCRSSSTINTQPLTPTVSVTPEAGVSEGTAAVFTLTASPAPAAALTVAVTVGQSGDYAAAGATGSKTVTIPPTSGTATYSVSTVDDSSD
ncbi:MAG: hypothetical protein F4Z10_01015, partial [Synechococcus sp. SB0666_bin_14]|nr:hypothetical protein [Synechococcus sp. SB0666_bin_14]